MYSFSAWVDNIEPTFFKNKIRQFLIDCGFWICSFSEKHFSPFGYSCVYTLSESHLAVHTFPEEWTAYVELSSCVSDPFVRFCRKFPEIATFSHNDVSE